MCSSNVSDTANRLLKRTDSEGSSSAAEEKSSVVPPISQRSHVGNLRQTLQGKGVIHKRVETAGVYPLVRPRGVSALPAEVQRKTPRPSGANTLTQFVCPAQPVQRNRLPPGKGEPFTRFGHTGKSVPRNLRSKSVRRRNSPDVFPCAMPQNALYLFYMT